MTLEKIPFHVEINRVIELLSKQIYQSPLSLLRENCQNSFDAILIRKMKDNNFNPRIDIKYDSIKKVIEVLDNGIGMSRDVLKNNFWKAGSSGKNNPEAKAAGVVGTFGIGAMANFGIAESLKVFTKSMDSEESIESFVERDKLSATENCITIKPAPSQVEFGTKITIIVRNDTPLDQHQAKSYIENIIKYSDIPIYFNNTLISQKNILQMFPPPSNPSWSFFKDKKSIGGNIISDIAIKLTDTGNIWCELKNINYKGISVKGELILSQNKHQIFAFRSKFALSSTGVSSCYGLGGFANLSILEPTAGREALTFGSLQILQYMITEVENFISLKIYDSESSANNTGFMSWIVQKRRYDLADNITVNLKPDEKRTLLEIKKQSKQFPFNLYRGRDQAIIDQYSNEDSPLIIGSNENPRKGIENNYFDQYCKIKTVIDNPTRLNLKEKADWNDNEYSFAFRLISILESDYFIKAIVKYGTISHNLPLLVTITQQPIEICLNSVHPSINSLFQMYQSDFNIMTSVVKDFIRNSIFHKISHLVPSSTRKGAEAFLKAIKGPKDIFEYQKEDSVELGEIWKDYLEGKISLMDAAHISASVASNTIQIVNKGAMGNVSDILPDVVKSQEVSIELNKQNEDKTTALPAISRPDIHVDYKLLLINQTEKQLNGYSCFLAISDKVRKDKGDFFLQPHRTEVIWGGQKVLFIFQHHSGDFGLYYSLKSSEIIYPDSGGGSQCSSTIIVKNRIFIPIPEQIKEAFIPNDISTKKFEVSCELLYPEENKKIN